MNNKEDLNHQDLNNENVSNKDLNNDDLSNRDSNSEDRSSSNIHSSNIHPSDQDLLLAADGELAPRRAGQVHAHLAACWDCRARMAEIEGTIADFARAHRHALDRQIPPADGPRALLRARLAQEAGAPPARSWQWFAQFQSPVRGALIAATLLIVATAGVFVFHPSLRSTLTAKLSSALRSALQSTPHPSARSANSALASAERGAEPDRHLTPGATRMVTISEVCAMPREQVVAEVSPSLRQQVLNEYGIVNARPGDYEIDYLITPGLGGVEDIHNLWPEPEPSASRTWNAHVKDELEEHLHEMVCAGKLDLSRAQRDLATDWIAAYKNYFHSDRPLNNLSSIDLPGNELLGNELRANNLPADHRSALTGPDRSYRFKFFSVTL
ncbi:MAG: hypothetical protein WA618_13730 [Terriglobales bacterium]